MSVVLEIKAGPFAGKTLTIPDGKNLVIGRAPTRAEFAIPHDTFMSGIHFAVEAGPQGPRLVDKKSSNGTFLNGSRITESPIKDGDEIRGGQTIFVVRLTSASQPAQALPRMGEPGPAVPGEPSRPAQEPAAQPPVARPSGPPSVPPGQLRSTAENQSPSPGSVPTSSAAPARSAGAATPALAASAPRGQVPVHSVGAWTFYLLPEGWSIQKEFGLQRTVKEDEFPSSIVVMEEQLGPGVTLPAYVEAQIAMLRQYLSEPKIEPAAVPALNGSDESIGMDLRYNTKDGSEVFYRRIYVRHGSKAGVCTLTTLGKDSAAILESLKPLWPALSFLP